MNESNLRIIINIALISSSPSSHSCHALPILIIIQHLCGSRTPIFVIHLILLISLFAYTIDRSHVVTYPFPLPASYRISHLRISAYSYAPYYIIISHHRLIDDVFVPLPLLSLHQHPQSSYLNEIAPACSRYRMTLS
jgi:hypothetical protein